MDDETAYIIDFANRSFRDLADQDYIMALSHIGKSLISNFGGVHYKH